MSSVFMPCSVALHQPASHTTSFVYLATRNMVLNLIVKGDISKINEEPIKENVIHADCNQVSV